MAEVYAGFLSHADHEIGRLLDYLEESGQLDNTMIVLVSDNGASGEGGPNGSVNENAYFNGIPDQIEDNLKYLDDLGEPAHLQPLPDRVGVRVQHAVQAVEALLQLGGRHRRPDDRVLAGEDHPDAASGASTRTRSTSCRRSTSPSASSRPRWSRATPSTRSRASASRRPSTTPTPRPTKQTQFYSMGGTRAIWHQGWKAAAVSPSAPDMWARYATQRWELFDTAERPERVPRPRRRAPGEAAGADRAVVGRRPAATRRCRSRTATRSRSSPPSGRSSPSRATATSTTRAAPRSPSRSRRTSATAPTRSRSRSRSTPRRPAACCSPTARGSAATRSTSRTASSSTSTTGSGWTSRSSSRPSRCRPATWCSRRRSSVRATRCRRRAR